MSSPLLLPPPGPRNLSTQTQDKTQNPSDLRVGKVSAVSAAGVNVDVAEGNVLAAHLDSYSPAIGDAVALMKTQDSWLIMGRTIGPGTRERTDLTGPGPAVTGSTLAGFVTTGDGSVMASSAVGVTVDLTKMELDYYHPENHHVLVRLGFNWTGSATTTGIIVDVWENTIPSPQQICQWIGVEQAPANTNRWLNIEAVLPASVYGGAARNINVAVTCQTTGTVTVTDNGLTRRAYMYVVDLGDTSFIPTK
jgi:hypothetical protein